MSLEHRLSIGGAPAAGLVVFLILFMGGCSGIRLYQPPVYTPETRTPAPKTGQVKEPLPQKPQRKPSVPETSPEPAKRVPEAPGGSAVQPETPAEEPPAPSTPRALAALNLVDKGRALIDDKKPDEAIRTLERALQVNPGEGKAYYYLAEAWLMKANRKQATEFNRLAGLYLRNSPMWSRSVEAQRERIGGRE